MKTLENTVPIPPRVHRLAAQLGHDPETLASIILFHFSGLIDWNIAHDIRPLDIGSFDGDYDLPAAMDALTPAEKYELTEGGDELQWALYDRNLAQRGRTR